MKKISSTRFEKFFSGLALTALSLILSFVCFEFISRLFVPEQHPVAFPYGFYDNQKVPKPYVMFAGNPELPGINPLGYPGKMPQKEKTPGVLRIFVLGGSTIYNGNPTIPESLEELIHRHGRIKAEVYNFGVPSSKSSEELARLVFEVADYHPDVVIIYDGGNDVSEPIGDPRVGYPFNFFFYESNPIMVRTFKKYPVWDLFFYGSNLLRYLFPRYFINQFIRLDEINHLAQKGSLPWVRERALNYVGNIHKAHAVAKGLGIKFFHFYQPLRAFQEYYRITHKNRLEDILPEMDLALHAREEIRPRLEELKKKEQLMTTDLSNMFNQTEEEVFTDWIHTHQKFMPVVAQEIFLHLQKGLKLK